jgi:hypothetical protein
MSAGCSPQDEAAHDASVDDSQAADAPLTAADLERFLAVVKHHTAAKIPEFTPPDEDASLDTQAPAAELVASFRGEVRRLFDTQRQGIIWENDPQWSQAAASQKISATRFAGLVRRVSLAIMRVRLQARVDVDQLVVQARRQVEKTVRLLDEIDAVSPRDRTRESQALRTEEVERLGKAVALLEFAEMVRRVSPESATVVRKYSRKLKPLLPAHANEELLAELKDLATQRNGAAQQTGYDVPEQGDEQTMRE